MLDKIILFSIKNKILIGIATIFLVVWGVWSATHLPIDAVPDITNNQVQIITVCPALAGQEVEQLVTSSIERSISNLPDLVETRSISRFGLSVITVVFDDDVDVYFARQLLTEKLKEAEENIPKGIGVPELAPVSTGLGEIYQYILHPKKGSESKYNAKDLRTMQDWIVARQLNGTKGIAEVNSFGGELKQYEVAISPNRLRAMGVSITDIFNALEQNNQNTGGAYIDKKPDAFFIRGVGVVTSLNDVRNIAIKNTNRSTPIFIRDVAEVRFGNAVRYGALTYNGEVDAVGGVVMMLKGENSNEVVKRIKAKIPEIQKSLPEDIVIEAYLDRAELVSRAIKTVEKNLIEGALIVIFVLVLFLGNFRAGLIVASAIPLAMLFALGMMRVFGVSANLMSLGAIDFGLIVDGAVIVVEATLHHLGLRKTVYKLTQQEMDDEVFSAASKIRKSAAFGEIIILIVYIPILSLAGIEGKMFGPMAKTVGFAILGALILSLTYIPMMSALFLSKNASNKETFSDRMVANIQGHYQPLLQKAIKAKYSIVGITVSIFIVCLFIFKNLGGEFIPQLQEGDFAFHCILPQGSSLNQSIETSMQASRIIKQFDEVKMVVGKTGSAEIPTDPMPFEATDLVIVLKPQSEWKSKKSYQELSDEIYEKLKVIPGVFFEQNQPIQMRFNELMTGVRQDVAVKIFGENLDSLQLYAQQVSSVIASVEGASTPQIEQTSKLPQINIDYDRTRLANYGITVKDVNDAVNTAFAGKVAGQVFEDERRFDLVVRLDSIYRTDIDDVKNLTIAAANGAPIPLSQVADISYKLGQSQISREWSKRRIVIGFNVENRDVQTVVNEIQEKLDKTVKLPTGYYFTYGGQFENLREASNRLMIAVPLALVLIFLLLYLTFHSAKQAALIFTAIPMSAIGGVLALLIRGMPFSISAGIGFIALFGVAVLNGIVLIGTFNQLEKEGVTDIMKRIIEGTTERLRPVLMTATVASVGFLPMALSTSAGAEVQKPLATVVIGGLISATFLTLFVLPLLYLIFNSKQKFVMNKNAISCVLLLLCFSINKNIVAQNSSTISMEEAVNLALKNNGTIKAKALEYNAAKSLKGTIGEVPKLEFNAQLGQYNSIAFDQSYQVLQSIPFPSLFVARKALVNAETKSKEVQKQLAEVDLKSQVRAYYCEIQYLQHKQDKLKHLDSLYRDFIGIAELRFRTGDTKKVEVSSAKAQRGEVNLLLLQNEVLLKNTFQDFYALLNTNEIFGILKNETPTPLVLNNSLDTTALAKHPLIQNLLQDAELAKQARKVEQSQGLPDFTLGYVNQSLTGYQNINGSEKYFNSSSRFHSVNVGISIPLAFAANAARMKSLNFQKQAAEANAQQEKKKLTADFQNVIQQYQQNMEQYNYYTQQALPNADEIINAARLSYKTGDISYVEYLFSLQTATNIQLGYLESIRQLNLSVINIFSLLNQ